MEMITYPIEGVKLIKPRIFSDDRGYFFESFREEWFPDIAFVQDNQSKSVKNVLRGLHYQIGEFAQDKLVRCLEGKILDVAVDIRKDSPTYLQYIIEELDDENQHQFLVPKGFAHGFVVLSETAVVSYKCSNYYHKESERSIIWNDPDIGVDWPISNPILSSKDELNPKHSELTKEDLF